MISMCCCLGTPPATSIRTLLRRIHRPLCCHRMQSPLYSLSACPWMPCSSCSTSSRSGQTDNLPYCMHYFISCDDALGRAPTSNVWRRSSWRSTHGGSTRSTWLGSNAMRSPRSPQMSMKRARTCTSTMKAVSRSLFPLIYLTFICFLFLSINCVNIRMVPAN